MLLKAVTDKPLIHNFLLLLIDQRMASRYSSFESDRHTVVPPERLHGEHIFNEER